MDTQQILDMLLTSGQELINKGKAVAEEQLQVPTNEADRQTMLDGAGKGAMAASALALFWGLASVVN